MVKQHFTLVEQNISKAKWFLSAIPNTKVPIIIHCWFDIVSEFYCTFSHWCWIFIALKKVCHKNSIISKIV